MVKLNVLTLGWLVIALHLVSGEQGPSLPSSNGDAATPTPTTAVTTPTIAAATAGSSATVSSAGAALPPPVPNDVVPITMSEVDLNKDGKLTRDECPDALFEFGIPSELVRKPVFKSKPFVRSL